MPRIPEELIDRIREASDIVEVVSEHVELRKAGRTFKGLCPFHNENTPSFNVNPDLQIYKCFGCGAGGNVFGFLQAIDRISFVEAVSFLAERNGIRVETQQAAPADDTSDLLYRANDLARKYFCHMLSQPQSAKALAYLKDRGLSDAILERFGLGYAPAGWDGLLKMATKRGFTPPDLERAGLLSRRQNSEGYYDRFRDRVTFPIANPSGRTIAFGARTLDPEGQPKYLNSPESPVYRKSAVLYGLDQTRDAIRKADRVLVVEGYMDLLSLVQAGVENVVASAGTALTDSHCRLLSRYARRVVLLFDGDEAGLSAALRGTEPLIASGMDTRVVALPDGHDPDSFARERGTDGLLAELDRARPALDFHLEQLGRRWDLKTVDGKSQAIEAVKPLLAQTQDAVRRDLLLRECAQRLGVGEEALRQQIGQQIRRQQTRQQRPAPTPQTADGPPDRGAPAAAPAAKEQHAEVEFLGFLLNHPGYIGRTGQRLTTSDFSTERAQRLIGLLFEQYAEATALDLPGLLSRVQDQTMAHFISTCAMQGFDEKRLEEYWEDAVLHFQISALTRRIRQLEASMREADTGGDDDRFVALSRQHMDLRRQRQDLTPDLSA